MRDRLRVRFSLAVGVGILGGFLGLGLGLYLEISGEGMLLLIGTGFENSVEITFRCLKDSDPLEGILSAGISTTTWPPFEAFFSDMLISPLFSIRKKNKINKSNRLSTKEFA